MDSAMAETARREQYHAPYLDGASWRPAPCRARATWSGPPSARPGEDPSQLKTRKSCNSGVRVEVVLLNGSDHFGDPIARDEIERPAIPEMRVDAAQPLPRRRGGEALAETRENKLQGVEPGLVPRVGRVARPPARDAGSVHAQQPRDRTLSP